MKKFLLFLLIIIFIVGIISFILTYQDNKELMIPSKGKIGLIKIEGTIMESEETIKNLKSLAERDSVKAIVIRVDSPGGGVAPSQEIYEEIKRIREKKKVLISMGSIAASGGYYISCAADKIVANDGTLTGSIGVIMEIPNIEELMNKIGIKTEVIKSGRHKDIASTFRSLSEEEKEILQKVLDDVHEQFISAVREGRDIPESRLQELTDGRIFTGQMAKEAGLVDELGGLEYTISLAAQMVGIEGKPEVVTIKKKKGIFDFLESLEPENLIMRFQTIRLHYRFI
jgi:protease-4